MSHLKSISVLAVSVGVIGRVSCACLSSQFTCRCSRDPWVILLNSLLELSSDSEASSAVSSCREWALSWNLSKKKSISRFTFKCNQLHHCKIISKHAPVGTSRERPPGFKMADLLTLHNLDSLCGRCVDVRTPTPLANKSQTSHSLASLMAGERTWSPNPAFWWN